jgi:hypothetical protein
VWMFDSSRDNNDPRVRNSTEKLQVVSSFGNKSFLYSEEWGFISPIDQEFISSKPLRWAESSQER